MYSATTDLEPGKVLESLNSLDLNMVKINVVGVDCFDAVKEDGSEKSCLVLKLSGEILEKAHKTLSDYGLVNSYENFSPHVTLRYNMTIQEAHMYRDMIRATVKEFAPVVLDNPRSETINRDYV
jgi:2'-5' RNA ligase